MTHDESPDNENTDDVNGGSVTRKGLSKGCNDDDHEFDTVWDGSLVSQEGLD